MQEPKQRPALSRTQADLSAIPNSFEPDYIPKVGLVPYEVSSTHKHGGSQIFNLIDTVDMGKEDLLKKLAELDPRILENMPEEVLKQIEDGNISHIFQTDPTGSQIYMDLSPDAQEALKGKGSIYLRTKEGKTARFKLPEIADGDAGWNANKGSSVFMDQTVYSTQENVRSLSRLEEVKKAVKQGKVAAETVDERILNSNAIDDILSGSQTLTGAIARVGGETIASAPTVTTGPTPGSVPSGPTVTTGETPVRVGKPVETVAAKDRPRVIFQSGKEAGSATAKKPEQIIGQVIDDAAKRLNAEKVTNSGNATPPPKATIQSTAPTPSRPSSGAPVKSPGRLRTAADDLSAAVTQGPNGARNLKMLGIAGALGVAGFALSRGRGSAQDDEAIRRRLEMQRRGTM